jgi:hypothetical protein
LGVYQDPKCSGGLSGSENFLRKRRKIKNMGVELIDRNTGQVIEKHDYPFRYFVKNVYSRFCSLLAEEGIIIGEVHPELIWREIK